MGGKLQGRALTAAQVPGHSSFSRLFFVTDCTTGVRFLIDTGAEVSVIPPIPNDRAKQQSGVILRAANDSLIHTFGTRSHTLDLGLHQKFQWVFIVAGVKRPILGVDFIASL